MAGIYIHIPFCKSRCLYCDFFSTTLLGRRDEYVQALCDELALRTDYLPTSADAAPARINTVYFGGGTPSLLNEQHISDILGFIRSLYTLSENAEITLEANPGDITPTLLQAWRTAGINRLSIGVQSFSDALLRTLGRRHTADEARNAVSMAQTAGFNSISIDLIYAIPGQTLDQWQSDLRIALDLDIQHISTYCLTFEPGTRLTALRDSGDILPADDDTANAMYADLCNTLIANNFEHYEVSNFARPGMRSQHNSSYWNDTPYLGIGAAAHSYDGRSRQWNPADLDAYISGIQARNLQVEKETLTDNERYNERVMLALRTSDGLRLDQLSDKQRLYCLQAAAPLIKKKLLRHTDGHLIATRAGINILNRVIEQLMYE